jgi:hypothetical protein
MIPWRHEDTGVWGKLSFASRPCRVVQRERSSALGDEVDSVGMVEVDCIVELDSDGGGGA